MEIRFGIDSVHTHGFIELVEAWLKSNDLNVNILPMTVGLVLLFRCESVRVLFHGNMWSCIHLLLPPQSPLSSLQYTFTKH